MILIIHITVQILNLGLSRTWLTGPHRHTPSLTSYLHIQNVYRTCNLTGTPNNIVKFARVAPCPWHIFPSGEYQLEHKAMETMNPT